MTGSTTISLFPVDDCENECEQFEFQLNQGDVCKYQLILKRACGFKNKQLSTVLPWQGRGF